MRIPYSRRAVENPNGTSHEETPYRQFWSLPEGQAPGTRSTHGLFRDALQGAGISRGGRGEGPARDLRLALACHGLRGWADAGGDASAPMPCLAGCCRRLTAGQFPGMVTQAGRGCGWVVPP
mgnify:CR=1 FL=1